MSDTTDAALPTDAQPPARDRGGWDPPPDGWPATSPPARRAQRSAGVVLVAVFAAGVASGVGASLLTRNGPATIRMALIPSAPASGAAATGGGGGLAPLPTPGAGRGGSTTLDPAAIAAAIDPALVDISVTFSGQGTGQATGMILTSTGAVLTNNHVVRDATAITVRVDGTGPQLPATVVGVDPTDDVALIQITGASGLPTVPIGDSSTVKVGDAIVALGNAGGRGGTPAMSQGEVTALDQTITASDTGGANPETLTGSIQIQAAIQPGDSGGPVVDASGRVIGMTAAGSARVHRSGTVGFAIPIDRALSIATQIQSGSGPNVLPGSRGILGVSVDQTAGVQGAAIARVQSGSPAEGAGIAVGDVIIGVDGTAVGSARALGTALQSRRPGDSVTVRWTDRAGTEHTTTISLAVGPPA